MSLSVKEEVIRKRKEELKEENELERIQAKRNLDFLDIVLLARVCCFLFLFFFFFFLLLPPGRNTPMPMATAAYHVV